MNRDTYMFMAIVVLCSSLVGAVGVMAFTIKEPLPFEVQCGAYDVIFMPRDIQSQGNSDEAGELYSLTEGCRQSNK